MYIKHNLQYTIAIANVIVIPMQIYNIQQGGTQVQTHKRQCIEIHYKKYETKIQVHKMLYYIRMYINALALG